MGEGFSGRQFGHYNFLQICHGAKEIQTSKTNGTRKMDQYDTCQGIILGNSIISMETTLLQNPPELANKGAATPVMGWV